MTVHGHDPGAARRALCGSAALLLVAGTSLAAARDLLGLPMLVFQLALLAAGGGWATLVWLGARGELRARWIVALAVLLRVAALFAAPALSDDPFRYAWEGEVVARGLSPYAYAPDDPRLEDLRQRLPSLAGAVGHPSIPAVYPPLAQALHAALALTQDGLGFGEHLEGRSPRLRLAPLRLLYGCIDLCVLLPLAGLLRRRGLPVGLIVTWALSPVVVLSYAGTGHLDALAILFLVGSLHLAACGRPLGAGLTLAAGVASKVLPLVAVPAIARAQRGTRRARFLLALVVAGLGFVLPVFLLEGGRSGPVGGLGAYGVSWEGGSLVFRHVDRLVRGSEYLGGDPRLVGRRILGVLWLAWSLWTLVRQEDPVRATGSMIGAWIVLTPTLHPWYLTWSLPFLALRPRLSWTVLLVLTPLLWWPVAGWQERGEWIEPGFVWPLLALPFMLLRSVEAARERVPREHA